MRQLYKAFSDDELVEKLNSRDGYAFEEVFTRYSIPLTAQVYKMTKDYSAAEDIVQDLFTKLYSIIGQVQIKETLQGYLYTCVRNGFLSWLRKNKRISYIDAIEAYANEGHNPVEETVRERELINIVNEEIEKMPPKMRLIFELSKKQFKKNSEIAEITENTILTVKKQLVLASKRIRSKFSSIFFLSLMVVVLLLSKLFK